MASVKSSSLSAAFLLITACLLQAGGTSVKSGTGSLISPDEMGRCVGGECTHSYINTTDCVVNQNQNNNPCPGTETCAVSPTNADKCVMFTKVTMHYPRCFVTKSKKQQTDCVDQSTGQNCATIYSGDLMNGTCTGQCTSNKGGCGSGVYTATETPCPE